MTEAERRLLDKHRSGQVITPEDTCATIACEAELEQYRIDRRLAGLLDAETLSAIAKRSYALRASKGVRGYAS